MPILIQCPNPTCAAASSVAHSFAGRDVKCKKCGTPFKASPQTVDLQQAETKKSTPSATGDPFPSLPAEFGRYRVLKLLGRGGMGAVYLAQDSQLGRQVALKLPSFDASETKRVERFVREARSAAGLMHPNICPVYDAGQVAGRPFITMAYIDGKSLDDTIDPDAAMDPRRAAGIARKVAAALHEAHDKGIVHRDLKPANVMLTAKGDPVVMDFGLAKRVAEVDPTEAKLTHDGAIMGTPSYMAPEQVKGDLVRIGPATDVYALGVMLFEMLTGHVPYRGAIGMLLGQILAAPVRKPSELRPDVDPRLDDICLRAMAKEPADRFPDMAAFEEALTQYLTGPTVATASFVAPFEDLGYETVEEVEATKKPRRQKAKTKTKLPEDDAEKPRSRLALFIAAGVAAVLLVVAGIVLTVRTKHGDVVIELSDQPAGVEVKVDGARVDVTGLDKPLSLTAGEHGLSVVSPDFETVTSSFTVKKGEKQVVKVTMKPKAFAVPAAKPKPGEPETPRATPGQYPTPEAATPVGSMPTGDFIPLFNGMDMTGWTNMTGGPAGAKTANGYLEIVPGRGNVRTKNEYGPDIQLKTEFWLPLEANRRGQARANSGIFLLGRYELQLLDSKGFGIAPQSACGALYGIIGPSSDAAGPPETWQTLDITFHAPLAAVPGRAARDGEITVVLNGTKVIEKAAFRSATLGAIDEQLVPSGPIILQDHNSPVRFRNLEIRDLNAAPPNVAAAPAAGNFVSVFNGKDLTGWLVESGDAPNWKIEEGAITVNANEPNRKESWLLSEKDYTDFIAKFEFRTDSSSANSGFALRAVPGERPVFGTDGKPFDSPTHLQIEVLAASEDRTRRLQTGTVLGGLKPQLELTSNPFGKQKLDGAWNEMEVDLRGQEIKVRLNGDLILDRNLEILVDQGGKYPGLKRAAGRIGFQRWQGAVAFRNLRIQELPAVGNGFVPLFNGTDLTGWKAAGTPRWSWANGRLLGAPAPGGGAGVLLTDTDFDDFEIELQYRLGAGAGSGLFLRADPNMQVSGGGQIEVQLIDDEFPQWAKMPSISKTGSVFNVFARKADPPLKRSDWNTLRAHVEKRRVQVWVNGVQTVDADLDSAKDKFATVPGLSRPAGRIGLQQNQKTEVEFRDLKVKRLTGQ